MKRTAPYLLLASSAVLASVAWAIRAVSGAHGHGLAAADRRAIGVLLTAAAAALVSGVVLYARRRR